MIDKNSNASKNINEPVQNQKRSHQPSAGEAYKQDQAGGNQNKGANNVVSPFTINLIESQKIQSQLATVPQQLLESNQRLTDFTSSDVNNTSGYNNRVTAATTIDISQLNLKSAKVLEIQNLSELLGVFGAQLIQESQSLQAGLNSQGLIQFWYHNRLYKINTESMAKSLSANNEGASSTTLVKEIESRFQELQNQQKALHLAFMVASPLLHQDISDYYDGLPSTMQYFRDDTKEILGHIDKQGIALRYRRSALTPQLLQQSVQKEGCMGLHLSLLAFNNGNEIQIQVEDNFGVKSRVIGEEQLQKLIFPNQIKFLVLTGQNTNIAAQLFQKLGIDHIICQEKTLDNDVQARQEQRLSLIFFRSFYQLLLSSDFSICQIFTIAIQNVADALGRRESKKFKMIKKGSGTQEGHQCSASNSIAKQIIKGSLIDVDNASNTKTFTLSNPYSHVQCDFRAKDLADILMKLAQPHTSVLQLYGESAIGKSTLIQYLLQQIHDRPNIYPAEKIVLLDCVGVKDFSQIMQNLANALLKLKIPGDPQKAIIQWIGRINEDGGSSRHLIVLDHMENIFQNNSESKKFTTFLNNIILMGSQLHFIIASSLPLAAEHTIQRSTVHILEGFNGEQAVEFFFMKNTSILDELTKNWEKLNELNENAIEAALEGKLDKKYLNLKTCNKRHQHSSNSCVVPYLAKHPLFSHYMSSGNPFLLNIISDLASKHSLGKIFKEMPSFNDNPIKAILEWVIFDKLDTETTNLLIMISCSQSIGGLTQSEVFRLRELVANMDDQKCRESLISLFDLGLIYEEQGGATGSKYIKVSTSFLQQRYIPEGLLEDPTVLVTLLDSLIQARKHQSKQEPKVLQPSGGRESEQQTYNNSTTQQFLATNNENLSKSKKNLFLFKRRELPSNNSPLLTSRKSHQITSRFDQSIKEESSPYLNSARKKNLFGNKSARKEYNTIVQDKQEEQLEEDENGVRNLQYLTPSKTINDPYSNSNQGNSQNIAASHQREIFFQSYSKGLATPSSPIRPVGGSSQSKFIKKSRKHILYLNSVLGSAKSQNTSPTPYRSTSGLVFQTNRTNNEFGQNDLLSFIKNYDMQRFTSNNETNQTSQNIPEFNIVKDWGLRLICKVDSSQNKFAENNERFQLRELAKNYQAIIQEIKKMKKVQLTLKKVTDVLHIVLTTEQQQSSFVKEEEDDQEDNSSLYIETESAVSKASSSGIYMQNSVKLRNSDYQMLQQLHRALQSTSSGDQKNTRDVISVLYQQQEMSSGSKSDSDLLMRANIGLLQVYCLMTTKTAEQNSTLYKQCILILENTIKIFEQLICKFGVAMCSVLLSHPSLCQLKTVTIKGVSSVDYLKIQAIPLFKIAGFTLGEQAGNMILEKKVDNPEVKQYLLTIIKTNKTPSFTHNLTEDSPLKQFSQGATGVVVPSSVKLLRSRVNSNADGTGITSQRASALGNGGPRGSKFSML